MKKLATAIAAIALIGTPAFAADMAVKMPVKAPPPPAPVYSWTGWYVGVNAGASFGNVKTDFNVAPVEDVVTTPPVAITGGFAGSNTEYPSGFMGGGQIGYNWQFSPIWVVGLEADFQGALERDSNTFTSNFSGFLSGIIVGPVTGSTVLDYQTKMDWFGTVRGRIGYVWGKGDVMSYLTGGLAYGRVDLGGTSTVSGTVATHPIPFSVTNAFSHNAVNTGWVVGYGTEGRLAWTNWSWKVEALYMDLGTLDTTGVAAVIIPTGLAGGITTRTRFTDGILRAGLNYQFH